MCPICNGSGWTETGPCFNCDGKGTFKLVEDKQRFASIHDAEIHELCVLFADALSSKLRKAEEKYNWRGAWKAPDWQPTLAQQIRQHVDKGDPLDVAAYCAFAWYHGWSLGGAGNLYDLPPNKTARKHEKR